MKAAISYLLILLMLAPVAIANPVMHRENVVKMKCCKKKPSNSGEMACHKQKPQKAKSCASCVSCPMTAVYIIPQKEKITVVSIKADRNYEMLKERQPRDFKTSIWRPPNADLSI